MDAKIDMLHQSGLLGKAPGKVGHSPRKASESDARVWDLKEVRRISNFSRRSLSQATLLQQEDDSSEDDHVKNLTAVRAQAASPLSGRGKPLAKTVDRTSSPLGASEGEEELDETEDEESDIAGESDDPDEWHPVPSRPLSTTTNAQNGTLPRLQRPPSPIFEDDVKAGRAPARPSNNLKMSMSELAQDLGALDLTNEKTPRRATRSTRQSTKVSVAEGDEDSIIVVQSIKGGEGKKKKR